MSESEVKPGPLFSEDDSTIKELVGIRDTLQRIGNGPVRAEVEKLSGVIASLVNVPEGVVEKSKPPEPAKPESPVFRKAE